MTALLNWRILAAIAVAIFLSAAGLELFKLGENNTQVKWDAETISIARQSFKLSEQTTRETVDLQAKSDTLKVQKNAQIDKLGADLAAALAGLRERPIRPADGSLSEAARAGSACTGASLYADDASLLVREAARADTQRLQLAECQAAYSNARETVNGTAPKEIK